MGKSWPPGSIGRYIGRYAGRGERGPQVEGLGRGVGGEWKGQALRMHVTLALRWALRNVVAAPGLWRPISRLQSFCGSPRLQPRVKHAQPAAAEVGNQGFPLLAALTGSRAGILSCEESQGDLPRGTLKP